MMKKYILLFSVINMTNLFGMRSDRLNQNDSYFEKRKTYLETLALAKKHFEKGKEKKDFKCDGKPLPEFIEYYENLSPRQRDKQSNRMDEELDDLKDMLSKDSNTIEEYNNNVQDEIQENTEIEKAQRELRYGLFIADILREKEQLQERINIAFNAKEFSKKIGILLKSLKREAIQSFKEELYYYFSFLLSQKNNKEFNESFLKEFIQKIDQAHFLYALESVIRTLYLEEYNNIPAKDKQLGSNQHLMWFCHKIFNRHSDDILRLAKKSTD